MTYGSREIERAREMHPAGLSRSEIARITGISRSTQLAWLSGTIGTTRWLIESDGCRCENLVKGKKYGRYFFSNESTDILRIFEWACDLVGVAHRRNRRNSISISRSADVEFLDLHIGYKY